MELSKHQEEKVKEALEILKTSYRLVLCGSAGTGKTTIAEKLIVELTRNSSLRVALCAPTHDALNEIRKKTRNLSGVQYFTVHKLLKAKMSIDNTTGQKIFKPDFRKGDEPLKNIDIVVADEASMYGRQMLHYIEKYANKTKIIFLGDDKQLNPVGEYASSVFFEDKNIYKENGKIELSEKKRYPTVRLEEYVRQESTNPIIELSNNLPLLGRRVSNYFKDKDDIYKGYSFQEFNPIIYKGISYPKIGSSKIIEKLAAVKGSDEWKYLGWTNSVVKNINFLTRELIYKDKDKPIKKLYIGEKLIFNENYGFNETFSFNTSEEITTLDYDIAEIKLPVMFENNPKLSKYIVEYIVFKIYVINPGSIKTPDYLPEGIIWIHEDSEKMFNETLERIKNNCVKRFNNWGYYYYFKSLFADLTYCHAKTVHKSQGKTYENVIINLFDINRNTNKKEKERLIYTAVTRPRHLAVLGV